ncbi:MAG: hypothetical protein Q8N47_09110 [Bryobacterales bacterium]|nr:hypothetical protein [Bryobacterales bacterium]
MREIFSEKKVATDNTDEHDARLIRGVHPRVRIDIFCFAWLAQGLDSGILAGQSSAGMEQALEVVGGRLDGGAGLLGGGLLDGVARGDARHVRADSFLEALARLVLDDGGFGEQVERARIHGEARAVGAGSGVLIGSSHGVRLRPYCSGRMSRESGSASLWC